MYVVDRKEAELKDFLGLKRGILTNLSNKKAIETFGEWVEERKSITNIEREEDLLRGLIDETKYSTTDTTGRTAFHHRQGVPASGAKPEPFAVSVWNCVDGFSHAEHVKVEDRGHGVTDVPELFRVFQEFLKDEPVFTNYIVPKKIALKMPKKD